MAITDKLTAIADAIRLKTGDDTPMTMDDMALRIGLIENNITETIIHEENWITINEGGNTNSFFNIYLKGRTGLTVARIENTHKNGNMARAAIYWALDGIDCVLFVRGSNYNTTTSLAKNYDFFIGAGSKITFTSVANID